MRLAHEENRRARRQQNLHSGGGKPATCLAPDNEQACGLRGGRARWRPAAQSLGVTRPDAPESTCVARVQQGSTGPLGTVGSPVLSMSLPTFVSFPKKKIGAASSFPGCGGEAMPAAKKAKEEENEPLQVGVSACGSVSASDWPSPCLRSALLARRVQHALEHLHAHAEFRPSLRWIAAGEIRDQEKQCNDNPAA